MTSSMISRRRESGYASEEWLDVREYIPELLAQKVDDNDQGRTSMSVEQEDKTYRDSTSRSRQPSISLRSNVNANAKAKDSPTNNSSTTNSSTNNQATTKMQTNPVPPDSTAVAISRLPLLINFCMFCYGLYYTSDLTSKPTNSGKSPIPPPITHFTPSANPKLSNDTLHRLNKGQYRIEYQDRAGEPWHMAMTDPEFVALFCDAAVKKFGAGIGTMTVTETVTVTVTEKKTVTVTETKTIAPISTATERWFTLIKEEELKRAGFTIVSLSGNPFSTRSAELSDTPGTTPPATQ